MMRVARSFPWVIFVSLLSGCVTYGGQMLKIDLQGVEGLQSMPKVVTEILWDLGYDWVPVEAADTRFGVKMAQEDNEYRMRFEYLKTRQVLIDVRIGRLDQITRLYFHEPGSQSLSASSQVLLQKLQARIQQEFGKENVSF